MDLINQVVFRGNKLKIILVAGARPNFMKIAPIYEELRRYSKIKSIVVHTGQHYDYETNKFFFDELSIPKPDFYLDVCSSNHGWQTGMMLQKIKDGLKMFINWQKNEIPK